MARMVVKSLVGQDVEFACYSERGIMAYFMLRVAANNAEFCRFLRSLRFVQGAVHPFAHVDEAQLTKLTIFSELEIGQGLGNPDGAFFFRLAGRSFFLWIQCKGNETYNISCSKSGASAAKLQLDRLHETPRRYANIPFVSSSEGVNDLFRNYVSQCAVDDNYFLLISNDRTNPFNGCLQPRETPVAWGSDSGKFCWLDVQYLERSPVM